MTESQKLDLILSKMETMETDISGIKSDVAELKEKIEYLTTEANLLEHNLKELYEHVKDVTDQNIVLLAKNHVVLVERIGNAIPVVRKELIFEVKISNLENEVKRHTEQIKYILLNNSSQFHEETTT